ncbi:zinc finger CCCH domain-containing protein 15 [Ananas comosus]|uniref:Zinc finger CCCH domain-containing protein 1 n=2 Tax=Ananas comosus TaxID=4615 RepID=A0A199W2H1_ANACO|nr:zinc finger CCCH domain-containing protein 15 [Ananas comosus]OAY83398.1 Zinc finger CCCH domain-containing protein 1 [Ananas comosus]CAD1842303.1 unnamed protein product [Ananas comosus var. bracteatus]
MADSGEVCNFFRKPTKNKNIRKRRAAESDDDDNDGGRGDPEPSLASSSSRSKRPMPADNKLRFSSAPRSSSAAAAAAEPDDAAADGAGSGAVFHFESSGAVQVEHDSRATATLETETEFDRDGRALRERTLKINQENMTGKSKPSSGGAGEELYKGMHGYTDHRAGFRREQTVAAEKAGGAHGPLRASSHIRVSARFDYQPDICKDYKETGYCGYGDSCKFMHDRGDYKSGWQLEKEWEEVEKARKRGLAMGGGGGDGDDGGAHDNDDDDDDDSVPFACFICRQPFEDPVVTNCKHYFCEHCALKHHSKNKKCFVCNKPTFGIFNAAHEIRKKMAQEK